MTTVFRLQRFCVDLLISKQALQIQSVFLFIIIYGQQNTQKLQAKASAP